MGGFLLRSFRLMTAALVLALQFGSVTSARAGDDGALRSRRDPSKASKVVDLLSYMRANIQTESVDEIEMRIPKYNRLQHFGRWVDADGDCQTTMTEILIRDADPNEPLTFRDDKQCALVKGLWNDPYTGKPYRVKTALQIDHVVALKNAYVSGAHAWDQARRCTYANYMGNVYHLLAVNGHENMSKGAQGPEDYMPPNEAFHCEYVGIWMRIKAIWNLEATAAEVAKIESVIRENRCPKETSAMRAAELANERKMTNDVPNVCSSPLTSFVQSAP
jgi:hypothetical protein